jgi:hypothetical protein
MRILIVILLSLLVLLFRHLAGFLNLPTTPNPSILLGLILISSWVIGHSIKNKRFPMMSGFLLYGILIGPYGLGVAGITDVQSLEFMRFMALVIIAFLAGGRLELKKDYGFTSLIPLLALIQVVAVLLGTMIAFLLINVLFPDFFMARGALFILLSVISGLILASGSPAVILAVNRENVSPVRFKEFILSTTVFISMILILPFLANGILFQTALSPGLSFYKALRMFSLHLFLVILLGTGAGFLLKNILSWLRSELIFFLLFLPIIFYAGTKGALPESVLSFMLAGLIVRRYAPRGKRIMKELEHHSTPLFVLLFTLIGIQFYFSLSLFTLLAAFLIFAIRYLCLRFATEGFLRLRKEDSKTAKAIANGFISQSGLSLSFIAILCTFPEFHHQNELCAVLTAVAFLNLLVGPPLLQRALYRIKTHRKT